MGLVYILWFLGEHSISHRTEAVRLADSVRGGVHGGLRAVPLPSWRPQPTI